MRYFISGLVVLAGIFCGIHLGAEYLQKDGRIIGGIAGFFYGSLNAKLWFQFLGSSDDVNYVPEHEPDVGDKFIWVISWLIYITAICVGAKHGFKEGGYLGAVAYGLSATGPAALVALVLGRVLLVVFVIAIIVVPIMVLINGVQWLDKLWGWGKP